jgi:hypothetical protein
MYIIIVYNCHFFLPCLLWPIVPTQSQCGGLLLHLITHTHTHTNSLILSRTPLDEGSGYRSGLYLTTQCGIRNRILRKRMSADPRLRPRGQSAVNEICSNLNLRSVARRTAGCKFYNDCCSPYLGVNISLL